MMKGFIENIEKLSLSNNYFREVLFTGQHSQLVVMSLEPKEDIGMEVHQIVDQFLRVEKGEGTVLIDNIERKIKDGDAIIIPAGTEHNIINTSNTEKLKLYTLYSPPHHKDNTVHKTKAEALKDESDHI
jgi:mannose-6-phosphate isomerase-like protein (cupin superfamily)